MSGRHFQIYLGCGRPYRVSSPTEGTFLEVVNPLALDAAFPTRADGIGPPDRIPWPHLLWKHAKGRPADRRVATAIHYDLNRIVAALTDTPWRARLAELIGEDALGCSLGFARTGLDDEWLPAPRPGALPIRFVDACEITEISLAPRSIAANRAGRVRWL